MHLPQVMEGNGLLLAPATSAWRIRLWAACRSLQELPSLIIDELVVSNTRQEYALEVMGDIEGFKTRRFKERQILPNWRMRKVVREENV